MNTSTKNLDNTTKSILSFMDENIHKLRPLVNKLVMNRDYLKMIEESKKIVGDSILKNSEWFSEDENERILEDKFAWNLSEEDFEKYCKIRYEGFKNNEVIRKLIPNIDEIGYNTCIEWIFNQHVISLSKELLEMFDAGVGTTTAQEYCIDRRRDIVNSICSSVKAYTKKF